MTENTNYCEHCGARLVPGANFCEVCGKQVQKPAPARPYQAPPPSAPPAPAPARVDPPYPEPAFMARAAAQPYQAPPPKRKSIIWPILGGGCCLGLLCGAAAAVGLILFANSPDFRDLTGMLTPEPAPVSNPAVSPLPEQPAQIVETPPGAPFTAPEPEPAHVEGIEPGSEPAASGEPVPTWPENIGQEISSTYLSDDFSNNQFNWASSQDEVARYSVEDGHYAIHVLKADYTSWAYLPAEFDPTFIGFDAAVAPGQDKGAYGVMCHYQDEDNYHFVSIDPGNKEYSIGYRLGGEYYELMQNMWMPSFYLHDSAHAVNNIQVACDPDMITLFINNELEAQTSIDLQDGGWVTIYGETWDELGPDGFKVLFDNLYAFIPVQ